MKICNPILPGFHPDPSILRVDDVYYIAVSTFEWWPGVQIYSSRDLVNWTLAARPLRRRSQLDMRGVPDSGGIWAPCLSYADGMFYLIYTVVHNAAWPWKDTPNYLVTATSVEGEWSEPVFLNSSGFDPSLFHDGDKKWLVNMQLDHRQGHSLFGGIVLQEYSAQEKRLVGQPVCIFRGSELGITEGPHLYKRNGWYYLLTAEGGTGFNHSAAVARSRDIAGPYTLHPDTHILTSRNTRHSGLQKAGHASLVQTPTGEWYLAHLCSRPVGEAEYCPLGRETALQKVVWREDWPYLVDGPAPSTEVELWPGTAPAGIAAPIGEQVDFSSGKLPDSFQFLRQPLGEDLSFTDRAGALRLYGRESLTSTFHQSLVARRWQHFSFDAQTVLDFAPVHFQQMAGLVCYYNTQNFYYLAIAGNDGGRVLYISRCINGAADEPVEFGRIPLPQSGRVRLGVMVRGGLTVQFRYAVEGQTWKLLPVTLDASLLSDDHVQGDAFTGAFVGLCCQDMSGRRCPADFFEFCYRPAE